MRGERASERKMGAEAAEVPSPISYSAATVAAGALPGNPLPPSESSSPFSSTRSCPSVQKATASSPNEQNNSKKTRRGARMVLINPPSAFHPDIHPPSLVRVQRALRAHGKGGPSRQVHQQARHTPPASPFRDAQGQFILQGSSGGFYVGSVLGALPHGVGQHHIPHPVSGKMHMVYDGEWSYGSKTGFGSVFYTNGEEYRGELRNNQRWGRGWMKYKDGSFYCGDWLHGRRHGIGLHYLKMGNCYNGAFCKDSKDGWGIFYWPSAKRRFEGEWVANQPYSGYYSEMETGELKFVGGMLLQFCPELSFCPLIEKVSRKLENLHLQHPNLPIFNVITTLRALKAGEHDPKALFKSQVGRKENLTASHLQILKNLFEVMVPMVDNQSQLHVTHLRKMLLLARIDPDNGQTWSGEVVDHIPHGQGVATYSNRDSFEGAYHMGKKLGQGLYKFANGATYNGEYDNNLRNGHGILSYPDKSSYDGSWKIGKRDGIGTYNYANGDIYKGEWLDDKRHGKGTYYFKDSMSQFCGSWTLGNFANGEWIHRDGNIYEGGFSLNKPQGPGSFKFFGLNNVLHGEYADQKWSSGQFVSLS